ncbi:MAG TPA: hypothetical protein VHK28_02265 [Candidatus Limnocylindria bacterium]|nr:hypothetical protein [Candidatus Limnocylindria bacterium]
MSTNLPPLAEPLDAPEPNGPQPIEPATPQMRLQMLSTEHWSLLASRNLAWNEAFTRSGMFLSTLSFTVVALALVGQASGFGQEFRLFALVTLPVVLFLGISTIIRLDSANNHDMTCVIGMNRIRAAYLELAPDLDRYFVMGTTDDFAGIETTMANLTGRPFFSHIVAAAPFQITVMNSIVLGTIAALVAIQLGASSAVALGAAAVGFLAMVAGFFLYTRRLLATLMRTYKPAFPARED